MIDNTSNQKLLDPMDIANVEPTAGSGIAKTIILLSWITLFGGLILMMYGLDYSEVKITKQFTVEHLNPLMPFAISAGIGGVLGFLHLQALGRILQHVIAIRRNTAPELDSLRMQSIASIQRHVKAIRKNTTSAENNEAQRGN